MAKQNSVTIDVKTAERIFTELEAMRKNLDVLKKKVVNLFPAKYGSDLWWEKEIEEAQREIKQGKYTVYRSSKDLINDLHAGI